MGTLSLVLRTARHDRHLVIALSSDDAHVLADSPPQRAEGRAQIRAETALRLLDAEIASVELRLGVDRILRAQVHLLHHDARFTLPAHFVDGNALARRAGVSLWIYDRELARAPTQGSPHSLTFEALPEAFRDLINTLDLGDVGFGHGEPETGDESG